MKGKLEFFGGNSKKIYLNFKFFHKFDVISSHKTSPNVFSSPSKRSPRLCSLHTNFSTFFALCSSLQKFMKIENIKRHLAIRAELITPKTKPKKKTLIFPRKSHRSLLLRRHLSEFLSKGKINKLEVNPMATARSQ